MVTISRPDQRAVRSQQTVKCNFYYYFFYFDLTNQKNSNQPPETWADNERTSGITDLADTFFSFFLPHPPTFLLCHLNENIFCNSCIYKLRKWISVLDRDAVENILTLKMNSLEMKTGVRPAECCDKFLSVPKAVLEHNRQLCIPWRWMASVIVCVYCTW